jgi:splicing suppressor protein 51
MASLPTLRYSATLRRAALYPPTTAFIRTPSHRTLFGFGKKKAAAPAPIVPLLAADDLFHPLSASPFGEIRAKGDRIKALAFCPVSMEKGEQVHVAFECPDCGYPTHASEENWAADPDKGRYWPRLKEANEDEHDLRSGRELTEFKLPGE